MGGMGGMGSMDGGDDHMGGFSSLFGGPGMGGFGGGSIGSSLLPVLLSVHSPALHALKGFFLL